MVELVDQSTLSSPQVREVSDLILVRTRGFDLPIQDIPTRMRVDSWASIGSIIIKLYKVCVKPAAAQNRSVECPTSSVFASVSRTSVKLIGKHPRIIAMKNLFVALVIGIPIGANSSLAYSPVVDLHAQAAAELLSVMKFEQNALAGVGVMADQLIRQNPALGPYRDVIMKWAATYMTWEKLQAPLVDMYEESFSEAELRDLIAFYKTPTGQKSLTVLPALMGRAMELGSALGKEHTHELETMIRTRAAELQKLSDQPK